MTLSRTQDLVADSPLLLFCLTFENIVNDRDVMAEIFRSISDALNLLGPGVLGEDGFELAAITLLVLERGHPCQREEDDEEEPPADDDEIAEIESVLLDAAVDVVVALARTLTSQFAPNIDPFYVRLIKSTVRLLYLPLMFRKARMLPNDRWLSLDLGRSPILSRVASPNILRSYSLLSSTPWTIPLRKRGPMPFTGLACYWKVLLRIFQVTTLLS